jgi:hypothetical protein
MAKKVTVKNNNLKFLSVAAVVLLFAIAGYLIIRNSYAGTVTTYQAGFANYTSMDTSNPNVFVSQDIVPGAGTQYVSDIAPGNKLIYPGFPSGKVVSQSTCYYVRVYNSPKSITQVTSATIEFVGSGSSVTATLPADDLYREVCAPAGRKAQLPYNIYNQSNAAYVLVYQAIAKT